MRQPRINNTQVQNILSHKVLFEEFTPNKSYDKSVIIRVDDNLYLSRDAVEGKETFDEDDWIKFCGLSDLEALIQAETERAMAAEEALDEAKLNKNISFYKVYATDATGQQIVILYDETATPSTIVRRDANGQVRVALTPNENNDATSKKYVDDINTELETNKQDRPDSAVEGNIAVFNDSLDTIDSNKTFITTINNATTASDNKIPTEKAVRTELDTKVDKVNTANQVYITDNNSVQTSLTYDTDNTANTIVERDNSSQINVNLTPTADTNATSKKYVDDGLDTKVNKNNDIIAATHTKITYDAKGLVTGGSDIVAADVTDLTATSTEINQLHESGVIKDDLTKLHNVTATSNEINQLHSSNVTTADLTKLHNVTATSTEINQLHESNVEKADLTKLHNVTATSTEINQLHESNVEKADLTKLHNVTADANELNILDGATLNVNELNILDGATLTTTELNYVDGVTSPIQNQLDSKVNKVTDVKKLYGTDSSGNQTTISYVSDANTAGTIVQRDASSQINVALTPTADTHATSKKYVDDRVNAALTEAVVFKGIVANETLLPTTGNTNGDMYWITAYSDNPPSGMTPGVSGSAIFRQPSGQTGEWNYTEDAIYQPDDQTIELDSNGKLSVMVSETEDNSLVKNNDGLYIDITGKVDKTSTANQLYGTSTANTQTTLTYDTSNTANTIVRRDSNSQINVALTPTANTHASSKKYVDTEVGKKVTANAAITGATKPKITYDSKGLVTAGDDLVESDIPSLHLSKISDVTATAEEVNVLDGITATTTELNYVDGVTSNIQTQLDSKALDSNTVHKTGSETITGVKTFTKTIWYEDNTQWPNSFLSKNNLIPNNYTSPENNVSVVLSGLVAADDTFCSYVSGGKRTNGVTNASLNVRNREDASGNNRNGSIGLYINSEGTVYTSAPTPTEDNTSSIQIDTVGARNTKIIDYAPNKNLSTLSDVGKNISNWSSNVTNCITEIPQHIKYTFADGVFTLKAGSKLYTPDGTEYTLTYDKAITWGGSENIPSMVFIDVGGSQGISSVRAIRCVSGSTDEFAGEGYHAWYDTTNNVIKIYTSDGTTPASNNASLPIAILYFNSTNVERVDQVFNGFGYIGSTIFVLPGVKGLAAAGKKSSTGTVASVPITLSTVLTASGNNLVGTRNAKVCINNSPQLFYALAYAYDEEKNRIYNYGLQTAFNCGDVVYESGKVTSLKINTPLHLIDYKDVFTKATTDYKGTNGLVPAPSLEDANKFLKGDGTWTEVDAFPSQSGNAGKFLQTDGSSVSWEEVDAFPDQTGQSGKFLTTDGSSVAWEEVDAFPSQSGNAGKFLTTDGTDTAWAELPIDNTTITKNSSNNLQAIGLVNKNTASGSTSTLYDWEGSLEEYNEQNIATLHPDWICFINDDGDGGSSSVYTKSEVDDLLDTKADKSTTYTKTEVNRIVGNGTFTSIQYYDSYEDAVAASALDPTKLCLYDI